MMPLDYPLWLRAAHFFNFLLLSLLVRSGLEILSAHPRLYWNDHCTPGSEWLKFTKKQRPEDRLWTASDEETSFPSAIALPGHENLGLGRHWHFLADFAWLLTGLTYVVMLFVTPEWRRLIPTSWQIVPDAWHAMLSYLSFHVVETPGGYNALQQLSYAAVDIPARTVQHCDGSSDVPSRRRSFSVVYQNLSWTAKRTEPAFPGSLHLHRILHRTRHDRGPAWFPERAGDDCSRGDAQSAADACSCGLAVRVDRHSGHPCRDNRVFASPPALCPESHSVDHRSGAHAAFRP